MDSGKIRVSMQKVPLLIIKIDTFLNCLIA